MELWSLKNRFLLGNILFHYYYYILLYTHIRVLYYYYYVITLVVTFNIRYMLVFLHLDVCITNLKILHHIASVTLWENANVSFKLPLLKF